MPIPNNAAPSATNPEIVQISQGGAVIGAANPLAVQASVGGAVATAANPAPVQLSQGNAALTAANPVPAQLSQGGAVLTAANPAPVQLSQDGAVLSTANPLPTAIDGFSTAGFGLLQTGSPYYVISARLVHGGDPAQWTQFLKGSGGISFRGQSGDALLSSGTGDAGDYATLQTVAAMPYRPGVAVVYLFTTVFPTDVANQIALAGPYHAEEGFGVGYYLAENSGNPGFMHRLGRRLEVQELRITTGATGNGNVTVTLNGTAHVIAVTNTADGTNYTTEEVNAREIAGFVTGFADATATWLAWAYSTDDGVTARVIFVRQTHGDAAGAFSFSAGATGMAASFTALQQGADGTNTIYPFNVDALDGSGPSGETIVWSRMQVWAITGAWLGAAPWSLWRLKTDGQWGLVHRLVWANQVGSTYPSVMDPQFPITYAVATPDGDNDVQLGGASVAAYMIGFNPELAERRYTHWDANRQSLTIATGAERPILAIQTARANANLGILERRRLVITGISLGNPGAKDVVFRGYVCTPADLTGRAFRRVNAYQPIWVDKASSALTAGLLADLNEYVAPDGSARFTVNIPIQPGQVFVITGNATSPSSIVTVTLEGTFTP